MRTGIHPNYKQVKVSCSCGDTWTTGSTNAEIKLDICSSCHPFYTGTQRLIDTAGRVDKFRKRYAAKASK
jgi:large subunit ribosomal protein L31